eukprot:Hpha_TRINITY_DN16158_c0_g1::TRINITY_DN16158_c0_g1_i1::g.5208::m.5208
MGHARVAEDHRVTVLPAAGRPHLELGDEVAVALAEVEQGTEPALGTVLTTTSVVVRAEASRGYRARGGALVNGLPRSPEAFEPLGAREGVVAHRHDGSTHLNSNFGDEDVGQVLLALLALSQDEIAVHVERLAPPTLTAPTLHPQPANAPGTLGVINTAGRQKVPESLSRQGLGQGDLAPYGVAHPGVLHTDVGALGLLLRRLGRGLDSRFLNHRGDGDGDGGGGNGSRNCLHDRLKNVQGLLHGLRVTHARLHRRHRGEARPNGGERGNVLRGKVLHLRSHVLHLRSHVLHLRSHVLDVLRRQVLQRDGEHIVLCLRGARIPCYKHWYRSVDKRNAKKYRN